MLSIEGSNTGILSTPAKKYPSPYELYLWIDGKFVPQPAINQLTIRESLWDLLPRLELTLVDDGMFTEKNPISTGMYVSVVANLGKEQKAVSIPFCVTETSFSPQTLMDNGFRYLNIKGVFGAKELCGDIMSKCYEQMPFSAAVEELCDELKLPCEIGVKTNDKMNWYMFNESYASFLNKGIQRCSVEDGLPLVYIDRFGKLNLKTTSNLLNTKFVFKRDPEKAVASSVSDGSEKYFSSWSSFDNSSEVNKFASGVGITGEYITDEGSVSYDSDSKKSKWTDKVNISTEEEGMGRRSFGLGVWNPSVNQNYFKNILDYKHKNDRLFSSYFTIGVNACHDVNLADVVELQMDSIVHDDLNNKSYSGKYMVGSIIHSMNKNNYNMVLGLFRDGKNDDNELKEYHNPLVEAEK